MRKRSEVRIVAGVLTGEVSVKRVMKIVAPLRVETVTAGLWGSNQTRLIEIAFRDHEKLASELGPERANLSRDLLEHVNCR